MNNKELAKLYLYNFLFWLSRKINYPLRPPDAVQVNFTFRCNIRCKMCSMHNQMQFLESQGRNIEIDSDVFRKVLKEANSLGTKTALFIGGEPFVRADLFDLIGYAKSLELNPIIVTNGILLNEENIQKCFETGVDWLSISIDAASDNTFSKIRGENVLSKIINNIELLNRLKRDKNRNSPKIVTVCTIMDDNLEELSYVVNLCKRLEISKIIFQPVVANNIDQSKRVNSSPCLVPPGRVNLMENSIDKLIKYKTESLDNFNFIANNIRHLKLIKRYFKGQVRPRELPCYAGYNRLQIVQEGKMYFCVPQDKYEAAFGDISKDTLQKLWFSKEAKFRRKLIKRCNTPCLQWCSYRDGFIELADIFEKRAIFKNVR